MIKKACAVIAAAGSGRRMGGISKPNIEILGKTLFEYVLEAFDESCVCGVNVVCSEDNEASLRALAGNALKPVTFTRGGATRAESVANGIKTAKTYCNIYINRDTEELNATLDQIRDSYHGELLLIKGSHGTHTERLIDLLIN